MSAATLIAMALDVEVDGDDEETGDLANDLSALIGEYGLLAVFDMLRRVADGAIDAHNDDPTLTSTVERLRTFSIAIATARGAVS